MTATATKTKTFIVRYPVTTYVDVEVERDANISEEDLLNSITKDDLIAGTDYDEDGWESLKCAWRDGCPDFILDENYDDVVFN